MSNATLDDDAVYECQVGPAPSNKPIRASARLNVMRKFFTKKLKVMILRVLRNLVSIFYSLSSLLFFLTVPPTKIEIAGIQPGSRMKIRENEAVELRCVVHDAKPKATIVWFRENTEFITGNLNRNFDSFRT